MKRRCTNPNSIEWSNYGARGITFDPAWKNFENFLADMGEAPEGLTLDRINTNGNYTKDNCRWATATEQARNKRNTVYVNFNGAKRKLIDVAGELGLKYATAWARVRAGRPLA